MDRELAKKLTAAYPKLFAHPMTGEPIEAFCFDCDDGWYDLIDTIAQQIVWWEYSQRQQAEWKRKRGEEAEDPPEYRAIQVKEKFGTLRFYTNCSDDYINGSIDVVQVLSSRTCEVCGAAGKTRGGGWVKTLCDKHAEELNYPPDRELF